MKRLIMIFLLIAVWPHHSHAMKPTDLIPSELSTEVYAFKVCGGWSFRILGPDLYDGEFKLVFFKCLPKESQDEKSK